MDREIGRPEQVIKQKKFLGKNDYLEIHYTQGFSKVTILYKDVVLAEFSGLLELERGVEFDFPENRQVFIQYKIDPVEFVVTVNGVYVLGSRHHPKFKVKSLVGWYGFAMVFGFIFIILSGLTMSIIGFVINILYVFIIGFAISGLNTGNKFQVMAGFVALLFRTALMVPLLNLPDGFYLVVLPFILLHGIVIFQTLKKWKFIEAFHDYIQKIKNPNKVLG